MRKPFTTILREVAKNVCLLSMHRKIHKTEKLAFPKRHYTQSLNTNTSRAAIEAVR